jgi:outer membrane protein OmpA-like peptidoglycan-associated protein
MNPEPTPDNTSGQPPAPATVAQARPSVAPAPQSQYQQPPVMHKKSRTGLIIAAILGGLLLIGVILFALIGIPAYSAIQARATATTFMSAVKYNDEAVMKKLSGDGRDGITDKAHAALIKEGVSYEQAGADKTESGAYNVHFIVAGSETLKDATVVVDSGKVTNFVINGSTKTQADATAPAESAESGVCLAVSDLVASNITNIDSLATPQTIADFYFKADSAAYDPSYSTKDLSLREAVNLYKSNSTKAFTFSLRGSVNEASPSAVGTQLAIDRSNAVKADLVAQGVPADRITVDAPESGTTADSATAFRTVALRVVVPTDCSASGANR